MKKNKMYDWSKSVVICRTKGPFGEKIIIQTDGEMFLANLHNDITTYKIFYSTKKLRKWIKKFGLDKGAITYE